MTKRVFISYRRSDTQMTAGRLHDGLVRHFSPDSVFRDKEAIRPGFDWADEIQRVLGDGAVVVALIGPQWSAVRDAAGARRLDAADDSNRIELETAFAAHAPVIPVLVEGATMPAAGDLPESLRPLTRRNALRLRDDDWDADFGKLASALRDLGVGMPDRPTDAPTPPPVSSRSSRAALVAGAAAVVAVAAGVWIWSGRSSSSFDSPASSGSVEAASSAPTTSAPAASPSAAARTPARTDAPLPAPIRADGAPKPSAGVGSEGAKRLAQLTGVWDVEQVDSKTKQLYTGTLTIDGSSGRKRGTLEWNGVGTAVVTELTMSDNTFTFTATYPNKDQGIYEATLDGLGEHFKGETNGVTSGASAVWAGTRSRGHSDDASAVAGQWNIMQERGDLAPYTGILTLGTAGGALSGSLEWKAFKSADIIDGRFDGRRLRFTARYRDGSASGDYEATLSERGTTLAGTTSGGGATAKWSAVRTP